MKVRIEMEINLTSGEYDVRFHNLSEPGADVDVARLPDIVHRVLVNVADNHDRAAAVAAPTARKDAVN